MASPTFSFDGANRRKKQEAGAVAPASCFNIDFLFAVTGYLMDGAVWV